MKYKLIISAILILLMGFFAAAQSFNIPNDPNFDSWDENNPQGNNWGQEIIKLSSAWSIATSSLNYPIALIDSGFDIKHEDLSPAINLALSDKFDVFQTEDTNNHGTHIAGIIGAKANNNLGIAGFSWDSNLRVYNYTFNSSPGRSATSLSIVTMALSSINKGAKIINLSLGYCLESDSDPNCTQNKASKKDLQIFDDQFGALVKLTKSKGRDVLFVIASGNNKNDILTTSPARMSLEFDNVIGVAAIQQDGELAADFSNYGEVTVAAPGVDIYSTLPNNTYGNMSGTSMAAPFVSGLAGLIWSRAEELGKTLTAAEVKQLIIDGAVKGGKYAQGPDGKKIPVINAYESLKLLEPEPPPVTVAPWPMFGQSSTRSGQSDLAGPETNHVKWTLTTSTSFDSPYFGVAPVVGRDSIIYVGNVSEGKLFAISEGKLKWKYPQTGKLGEYLSAPAIATDGTVYIGSSAGTLFAVNPDGTLKWKYETDTRHWVGSPAIDENGNIYFTTTYSRVDPAKEYLYAINPDGIFKWRYQIESFSGIAHTAIGPDGTIYSSCIYTYSANDSLYAVNSDGTLKWKKYYRPGTSPVVATDGTIYFKNGYVGLEAVDPNGTLKWWKRIYPDLKPSVAANGIIIADDTVTRALYAINPDGTEKWVNSSIGRVSNSSAAIGADGTVYITTNLGLFALDINDGSVKWKIDGINGSSPAIGENGVLYVGWYKNIYAIGE